MNLDRLHSMVDLMDHFRSAEFSARIGRNMACAGAIVCGGLTLVVAWNGIGPAFIFGGVSAAFARLAVMNERHRFDAIFARGVAAALAEGEQPEQMAEAA